MSYFPQQPLTASVFCMKYAEFSTILNLIDVHNYRVTLVVAYLGWVDFFLIPLSAWFCMGRWEFGRIGWSTGQGGGTLKIIVIPTKVHDHKSLTLYSTAFVHFGE